MSKFLLSGALLYNGFFIYSLYDLIYKDYKKIYACIGGGYPPPISPIIPPPFVVQEKSDKKNVPLQ